MNRLIVVFAVVGALAVSGSPAAADGNGECRQAAGDFLVALSAEGTRGDYMSDVLFGNEPNMADGSPGGPSEQEAGSQAGNVLASWSPGPFINTGFNEPPRNDRTRGFDGGDLQAAIREACD